MIREIREIRGALLMRDLTPFADIAYSRAWHSESRDAF